MRRNFKIYPILLPLSWIYGWATEIRNKLFDWKVLPSEEFPVFVLSVGNLTVGGTGKTPHTEYLIRLLSRKQPTAVLSRGYKRKSKGFVLAEKNTGFQDIGDEPFQMFRKFPSVIVAVDNDRRRGIARLLQLDKAVRPEVILLDDAFQHRYVKPSLSILLTDYNRLFYKDKILPCGRLREYRKNKKRAQIIIVTKCPDTLTSEDYKAVAENIGLLPGRELFFSSYKYKSPLPVFLNNNPIKEESIDRLKKETYSVLLLAGLANPSALIQYLNVYFADIQTIIYPDHHAFNEKDMNNLSETFRAINNPNKIVLTSEKDAARLWNNPYLSEEIKPFVYYLPIEVVFRGNDEELFTQKIENHVTAFAGNRILA